VSESSEPRGGLRLEVARTLEELEQLRPAWDQLPWQREEAAYEYFVTRLRTRPDVIGPFAAVVWNGDRPVAGLAGRIESRRLQTALGYRVVYAPLVRLLQVVDGGIVYDDRAALEPLAGAIEDGLGSDEVDVVAFPPLELGSDLFRVFGTLGGAMARQPFIAPWTRRALILPAAYDDFLASLGHRTRKNVRRDARQLESAFGERLKIEIVREPGRVERLIEDADRVARSTYQRRLGAGFADTPEQRALALVGLEHGWLRGYLLYLDAQPIAYWLCSLYGDTMLLKTGGFDEAYEEYRVGIFLLMRVIEDACRDAALRVLDFGPGDTTYKQQFSNQSRDERNVVVYAPTFRSYRINATRTAILGPARLARGALDAARLTDRVRAGWRGRRR
jgi:hypothetical protein